jgi:NAD(P)-dependent dehydrogenase (short-subunit alcohol dehydrogenase family)
MRGLDGKIVIVTGGGSGIGAATCRRFAEEGASVVVTDVVGERADEVAGGLGGSAMGLTLDVVSEADFTAAVDTVLERFGRIDVLHNNAAITDPGTATRDTDPLSIDLQLWDTLMEVDLRGALLGCRAVLPVMIEQGQGVIVNTSSTASLIGGPMPFIYSIAKAGVNALTLQVASLYARQGIRCNAVCPGPTATPGTLKAMPKEAMDIIARHTLAGRWADPSELAAAIVFLASDDASYMTGQIVTVDGGMLAHAPMWTEVVEAGQSMALSPEEVGLH